LIAVLTLAGCTTGRSLFIPAASVRQEVRQLPPETNLVMMVTNQVTNFVEVIRPSQVITNWLTNTIYTVNPDVENGIRTARTIAEAVPSPVSGVVSGFLGLSTAVLGWIAKMKSDKAALVPAIIQGVELSQSPDVKQNIETIARAMGVEGKLNEEVKKVTG
jgi:hypothetical protein